MATAAAAAALSCLLSPAGALAAAGDLDPSFSDDGRLSLVAAGPFVTRAVALAPDGGIVVGGYSCAPDAASRDGLCKSDGDSSFRLARFTADGGLDSEFGDRGLVTTQVGATRSQAFDILIQPDGKIVAGGVARDVTGHNGRDTFALARFTPGGEVDRSFGSQGTTITRVGSGFAAIADLAAAPDGSIVAVGQGYDSAGRASVAVARYSPAGALDTSFNAPLGYALTGPAGYNYALGGAVFGDGGVVAAGIAGPSADPERHSFSVVRLTPAGNPEPAFDGDGAAEFAVGSSSSFANAIAAQPGGWWVAAGAATDPDGRQAMALARGTPAGALDPGWDGDGIALARAGDGAVANDLVLLPDGRAIAAGQATTGTSFTFALARFSPAGALDPSFAGGGATTTAWANFPVARGTAAALVPDGRVVVAGIGCQNGSGSSCTGGTAVLLLARYLADPPSSPSPPPAPPAIDRTAPPLRFLGLRPTARRSSLMRRGLLVRVDVGEDSEISAELLGRGSRRRVVADRPGRRGAFGVLLRRRALGFARGVRTLRMLPAKRPIGRTRRFSVRIVVRATDRAGNATTIRRTVKIR